MKNIILIFLLGLTLNSAAAERVKVEHSSDVTLSTLMESVYQQDAAHHNEFAKQQQINANTELANRYFADANTVSLNHFNDAIGSNDGLQEWEASVDMPLWLSGQQQQQHDLSKRMTAELPASQQKLKLDASAIVRELVWTVTVQQTVLEQAHQAWKTSQQLEQDIVARVESGDLAGMDQLLAKTHVLDMQNAYIVAKNELLNGFNHYQKLTGQASLPSVYEEELSDKQSIDESHPALNLINQEIQTLQAKQSLAYYDGATNSNFSLGVKSERGDDNESFNHSVGLGFSFALNDDSYQKSAVADAAKALADMEINHQKIAWQLNVNLTKARQELSIKEQQLELVTERDNTTRQYLVLQQRAFDLGEIDLVSLLRSRDLANKSQHQKQNLELSIKHCIANVNQALGIIL